MSGNLRGEQQFDDGRVDVNVGTDGAQLVERGDDAVADRPVRFEKTGDRIIEFEISYLLEKAEDEWRILSYISCSDQNAEMEKEGLL